MNARSIVTPLLLAGLLACTLLACSGKPTGSEPAATAPGAIAPAGTAAAPAASQQALTSAATATQESSAVDAGQDKGDAGLEKVAALPAEAQLPGGKWVAGTHYHPVVPAQPTDVPAGKVEVIEVFWYACPHCYQLDPYVESWRKSKPAYIEFVRIPVTWGPMHRAHARLFYTLLALGKEDALHSAVFDEIQQKHNLLASPNGQDDAEALRLQLAFAKAHGIGEAEFLAAYNSFTVQTNLQKADEFVRRYKVEGVPLVVINGKYTADEQSAGSASNLVSLIGDLAANERHH